MAPRTTTLPSTEKGAGDGSGDEEEEEYDEDSGGGAGWAIEARSPTVRRCATYSDNGGEAAAHVGEKEVVRVKVWRGKP